MDSLPSSTSESDTTITDLNDDCLIAVFKNLNLDELCVVADVCSRFRQNAKTHFAHSKLKDSYKVQFMKDDRPYVFLLSTYKVLRNFGVFIKKIDATQSSFRDYEMSHLRKLTVSVGGQSKFLLSLLPEWSPELLELTLCGFPHAQLKFQQNFRKLEKIVINYIPIDDHTLDHFQLLIRTPQLKHFYSSALANFSIFSSMAKHVPQIETIRCRISNCLTTTKDIESIKFIGQLNNLKSLGIRVKSRAIVSIVVREIMAANIQLQHLALNPNADVYILKNEFIPEILEMKKLKALELGYFRHMSPSNLIDICRHLSELTELDFRVGREYPFSADNLVEMIQNGEKLRLLRFSAKFIDGIDDDAYTKIVNLVQNRRGKTHLKILMYPLRGPGFTPRSSTREYDGVLTLKTVNGRGFTEYMQHSEFNNY